MVPTVPMTPTRPVTVGLRERARARLDHAEHGDRELLDQLVERGGRGRVARDHDDLDVVGVDRCCVISWANPRTSPRSRGPYG